MKFILKADKWKQVKKNYAETFLGWKYEISAFAFANTEIFFAQAWEVQKSSAQHANLTYDTTTNGSSSQLAETSGLT